MVRNCGLFSRWNYKQPSQNSNCVTGHLTFLQGIILNDIGKEKKKLSIAKHLKKEKYKNKAHSTEYQKITAF